VACVENLESSTPLADALAVLADGCDVTAITPR